MAAPSRLASELDLRPVDPAEEVARLEAVIRTTADGPERQAALRSLARLRQGPAGAGPHPPAPSEPIPPQAVPPLLRARALSVGGNGTATLEQYRHYHRLLGYALEEAGTIDEALAAVELAIASGMGVELAQGYWKETGTTNVQGLPGWRNVVSGEVRYQQIMPGSRRRAAPRQPAQPGAPQQPLPGTAPPAAPAPTPQPPSPYEPVPPGATPPLLQQEESPANWHRDEGEGARGVTRIVGRLAARSRSGQVSLADLRDELARIGLPLPRSQDLFIGVAKDTGLLEGVPATDPSTLDDRQRAALFHEFRGPPTAYLRVRAAGMAFSGDVHSPRAQRVLDRALKAAKALSAAARKELAAAFKKPSAEAGSVLSAWLTKYRLQLANLLSGTQLAALLEGAREVAGHLPAIPPAGVAVPPPPTLPPAEAVALLDRLGRLDPVKRDEAIYRLPPAEQAFARASVGAGGGVPPGPSLEVPLLPGPGRVHLATIEEAARLLAEKNVVRDSDLRRMEEATRSKAFTVAGADSIQTLEKVRDLLALNVEEGASLVDFQKAVEEEGLGGTFLSDPHLETVFRTNVQAAFSDGQLSVLRQPYVRSGFPYARYDPINDSRVRDEHLALETLGIDGTNVYRVEDPVFESFRPPWDYNCRCGWVPTTIASAAEMGVKEAQEWLRTGMEPSPPARVPWPDFRPPAAFRRSVGAAPLAVVLSLAPLHVELAQDPNDPSIWHGPKPPGPGWVEVGTGPRGGKMWKYQGQGAPQQQPGQPQGGGERPTHPVMRDLSSRGYGPPVPPEMLASYQRAFREVLEGLPPTARERLRKVMRKESAGVIYYPDMKSLTEQFWKEHPTPPSENERFEIGGFVNPGTGQIHLDGAGTAPDVKGIYDHEVGHLLDLKEGGGMLSTDPEWVRAWEDEIKGPEKITTYARTNSTEGFAEFWRLAQKVGRTAPAAERERFTRTFPACVAFLKKNGVW